MLDARDGGGVPLRLSKRGLSLLLEASERSRRSNGKLRRGDRSRITSDESDLSDGADVREMWGFSGSLSPGGLSLASGEFFPDPNCVALVRSFGLGGVGGTYETVFVN